ncbi:MAG: ABC transporter permease [Bryobacterales bacterium]|nr:ABC transporter permease [Bryobacterales bacterium]
MLPIHLFRLLLLCFPASFRREYGEEMVRDFTEQWLEARRSRTRPAFWLRSISDVFTIAPREHYHVIRQDVRYALRTLRAQPNFTAVAVLSLALGIGANAAIFSLVHKVLLELLPVRDPESLILLTDGVSSGFSTGSISGERPLLTHEEFVLMRGQSGVFAQTMATYHSREPLQVRVKGGEAEEVSASLVSSEYFDTLGVPPAIGRTFTADDGAKPALAVISNKYWQKRFGGSDRALGAPIALRRATFTIVGAMPAGFFGDTVGQHPDIWFPLAMQPEVLPGRDWLHDDPATLAKTIWLQVFARLKPGVPIEQAQAQANTVFQQSLSAFYASAPTSEMRREFLDQRLRLRPAPMGGSAVRENFGEPLLAMLAAAGLVFLIACANLGNLMLTRAMARTREMAVRQALGAGRGDLARQWLSESMLIAVGAGIIGLLSASLLRAALLRLVPSSLHLPSSLDMPVVLFTVALTVLAGLVLGILPILRTMKTSHAGLREQGRGVTSSAGWLRAGRLVVAGQVALSLPLLIGAALLARTLDNLRHVDFGFATGNLLMARVDVMSGGYEEPARQPLFERLHERLRALPGVASVSYSPHGMLMGGDSGDEIEVEGYVRRGGGDEGSRYDLVGPGFFSTLGIPLRQGRAIDARDRATTAKVCVINEAFAKKFFAGRNPIGHHVTQVFGHQRNTFEIVGVAGNARKRSLRREIEHRFYIPISQPVDVPERVTFAIRTAGDPAPMANAVRAAILAEDPHLPISQIVPLASRIEEGMVQERMLATLSLAFGAVALLLAAIGLYGVLSYGVGRRTNEIGIRKALGARETAVVALIMRESSWLLAGGLAAGFSLAFAALRSIESRLFGLSPLDPGAYAAAALVLAAVGLLAAWLPARRASRIDPVAAIRYE